MKYVGHTSILHGNMFHLEYKCNILIIRVLFVLLYFGENCRNCFSFHCKDKVVEWVVLDQQSSQNKSETMLESYIYVHRLSLFVICIEIDISVLSFK